MYINIDVPVIGPAIQLVRSNSKRFENLYRALNSIRCYVQADRNFLHPSNISIQYACGATGPGFGSACTSSSYVYQQSAHLLEKRKDLEVREQQQCEYHQGGPGRSDQHSPGFINTGHPPLPHYIIIIKVGAATRRRCLQIAPGRHAACPIPSSSGTECYEACGQPVF